MTAHWKSLSPVLAAFGLLAGALAMPTSAQAGPPHPGGGGGCCKPKPPCCKPIVPDTPGHGVKVPPIKIQPPSVIIVPPTVIVNASARANAVATSSAFASSNASSNTVVFGGGGGGGFATPGTPSALNLNVVGAAPQIQKVPFQASRTQIKTVVIRAVCIDDKLVPHPASQVFPGQDVADHFEGELYRCIAGSRLQITLADWLGKVSFDGGWNMECAKGEALHYGKGGALTCRPQKPARDCNERSLLRRYGVGVKVLKLVRVETYTAYREEVIQGTAISTGGIVLDGGVGGIQF